MSSPANSVVELHRSPFDPTPLGSGDVVAEALRWYSRDARPGAHMVWTIIGTVLMAVSTPSVYVWIDGVRLVHVQRDVWMDRWGRPVQDRPGSGVLLVALSPMNGTLVRTGQEHYVVLDGDLVPIDVRVYRHLLRQESAA